jgi:hypothetical protein
VRLAFVVLFSSKMRNSFLSSSSTTQWLRVLFLVVAVFHKAQAFTVVLAGGTGALGQSVAAKLETCDVVMLTRNAFLAAAPNRVTEQFGWVGSSYLKRFPHVQLRDWDGGDLLDIVGQDWVGWQEDALKSADVVVHLAGGYTEQRTMACERLVRESLQCNRNALHVTVSPTEEGLEATSPGVPSLKNKRIQACEEMVRTNCATSECLRLGPFRIEEASDEIVAVIQDWKKKGSS